MSLIMKLAGILEDSKREYEALREHIIPEGSFDLTETVRTDTADAGSCSGKRGDANMAVLGDNLDWMRFLLDHKGMAGRINLIYIDPPFFSRADYGAEIKLQSAELTKIPVMKQSAYRDTWENGMEEYLKMMAVRLLFFKELLAEDGCLWVHLDWHAVHYIKILLDEIFGEKNFVNEVIWQYKSGGASKRTFARKHDTLLFYSKTGKYYFNPLQEKSYNRGFKPYRFKGVKEYRDEIGWYTMVNRKDVWHLDMVGRTSAERTGYVTQKPESLLEMILESCTRPGDLCADFFGGSGTLAAAAQKCGRCWITCDVGKLALINTYQRLVQSGSPFELYISNEGTQPAIGVEILAKETDSPLTNRKLLQVKLLGYENHRVKDLPIDEKYVPVIRKIMKKDPMQLIACWSVDPDYRGGPAKPAITFCKGKATVPDSYESFSTGAKRILVRVTDIFGNSISVERELE